VVSSIIAQMYLTSCQIRVQVNRDNDHTCESFLYEKKKRVSKPILIVAILQARQALHTQFKQPCSTLPLSEKLLSNSILLSPINPYSLLYSFLPHLQTLQAYPNRVCLYYVNLTRNQGNLILLKKKLKRY
jgi:hypothetical protein